MGLLFSLSIVFLFLHRERSSAGFILYAAETYVPNSPRNFTIRCLALSLRLMIAFDLRQTVVLQF
jgi:hypothetical protein